MDHREALTSYPLRHIPLWHIPIPVRRRRLGTHPSLLEGIGSETATVRALEPGEDRIFYSPHHSAEFHAPWGVFFRREEGILVTILLDGSPAMRFASRGSLTKFDCAVKIFFSLAHSVIKLPNEGIVSVAAIGDRVKWFGPLSEVVHIRSSVKKLSAIEPQTRREISLSSVLKEFVQREKEHLIVLVSDFLWPAESNEWRHLENACRIAEDANHEIVFLRVLDEMEQGVGMTASSVSLFSHRGRTVWTSLGIWSLVTRRQDKIREKIFGIVEKPKTQFFECVVQDPELGFALKSFLKRRARYARSYLMRRG